MDSSLRILHVEDSVADAELVRTALVEAGMTCQITRVQTADEFRQALAEGGYDLILVDYTLPAYNGMSALKLARQVCPTVPILFVSGTIGEDAAIEALTAGATDYVLKDRLSRLVPAVRRARCEVENLRERKQAEEALAESEEKYRDLVERARDIIYTLDAEGRITFASPAVEEILEYAPHELLGRSFLELVPEEMRDEALAQFDESLRSGQFSSELTLIDKQGLPRVVEYSTSTIEASGRVLGTRGIARDITARLSEKERFERELRESEKRRAEAEKLAAISRVAARAAHEINNPLAGIRSCFRVVRSAVPQGHPDLRFAEMVEKEIDRITTIVSRMYELYPLEQGQACRTSVREVMSEVLDMTASTAHEDQVRLENCIKNPNLIVRIPQDSLRQVAYNLLINALESSPPGSTVRVDAKATEHSIEITITDQGPGIPAEFRDRIFEPFFTTKDQGGLGLGLSIARGVVEAMRGTLELENAPGNGAVARVTLPSHIS